MDEVREPLLTRLAAVRERLDFPPGVIAGVLRIAELDPLLRELETTPPPPTPDLVTELERLATLLSGPNHGTATESLGRRVRVVEILRRVDRGRLPVLAFDEADAFGREMQAMLSTDAELCTQLGRLHPLLARATSVAPPGRWLDDARALLAGDGGALTAATRRTLASLVRADIVSRPDILVGGVRLTNQRLARGLLWFASVAIPSPAELLGTVGLRMGTSGRNDAVVRDAALANTSAALLGASEDPDAAAYLASMRIRIVNRTVLKQVDRALEALAAANGRAVADLVELALPGFGLDSSWVVELPVAGAVAVLELEPDGRVTRRFLVAGGTELAEPSPDMAAGDPGGLAEVDQRRAEIMSAIAEERRRFEDRFASARALPEASWRRRFADHPIGGHFGRRLIWTIGRDDSGWRSALPHGDGWIGPDGREIRFADAGELVRLWHPVEGSEAETIAWRATLALGGIRQPVRQADRETFRPLERDAAGAADRRFSGRVVDLARLRALLRDRGWAVPVLGAWDQGDEATAFRAFDAGLRAELAYQAVERPPTGSRHERARLVGVRFVEIEPVGSGAAGVTVRLTDVPPRVFSEALRDVSLVVSVGETPAQA